MDFDTAFARLVNTEGGFTDDPHDSGNWTGGAVGVGELRGTKYGVSAAAYPDVDIRSLTLPAARAIYRRDYWEKAGGGQFDPAISFQLFDFAVNAGVGTAKRALQRAAGVAQDGIVGPITIAAVRQVGVADVLMRFNAVKLRHYTALSTWPRYGKGWANRVADDLEYAAEDS